MLGTCHTMDFDANRIIGRNWKEEVALGKNINTKNHKIYIYDEPIAD